MRIGILTGGALSENWFLKDSQEVSRFIVADHGMDAAKRLSLIPEYIVGDFDSATTESLLYFHSFHQIRWEKHKAEKDQTDTELAMQLAISLIEESGEEDSKILLYGATGTRLDHALGNIHCLKMAFEKGIRAEIRDPYNRIYLVDGFAEFEKDKQYGEFVSFVPLEGEVKHVTLEGFFYPLKDVTVSAGNSLMISNRIVEEKAAISCEGKLICFETKDRL